MSDHRIQTKPSHADISSLVMSSLKDVLEMSDNNQEIPVELGVETRLIGREGLLDSMGLVTLIVDVEQGLEENYDVAILLADERAMSQSKSPFRSVGSLTEYISMLLEEQG